MQKKKKESKMMSDEIILAKPFNHDAKNIWEACGFDQAEMDAKLKEWTPQLNSNMTPSKMIEFVDGLGVSNRLKVVIAYYVCGIQSSIHFDRVVREMTAITAQQLEAHRAEIRILGGSINPLTFGKQPVPKKNRAKARPKAKK